MKMTIRNLKRIIVEAFNDVATSKEHDPGYWGIEDNDESRVALRSFLEQHLNLVQMGPNEGKGTEAEYVMFVDDMEGMGVRDALSTGDIGLANQLTREIMKMYPPDGYDPFANDYRGTDPTRGPGRGN